MRKPNTRQETLLALVLIDKREELIVALQNYDEGGKFLDVLVDTVRDILRMVEFS